MQFTDWSTISNSVGDSDEQQQQLQTNENVTTLDHIRMVAHLQEQLRLYQLAQEKRDNENFFLEQQLQNLNETLERQNEEIDQQREHIQNLQQQQRVIPETSSDDEFDINDKDIQYLQEQQQQQQHVMADEINDVEPLNATGQDEEFAENQMALDRSNIILDHYREPDLDILRAMDANDLVELTNDSDGRPLIRRGDLWREFYNRGPEV